MPPTGIPSYRPAFMGTTHMVSSNNYLASLAGYRILEQGGTAIDAGVATGLAINVTMPQMTTLGGVAPIIMYFADTGEVTTVSGLGRWPKYHTLDAHIEKYGNEIPSDGMGPVIVPSAADAWLTSLEKFGTMSFEQVAAPALDLAENGSPFTPSMQNMLNRFKDSLRKWPANAEMFMPGGKPYEVGDIFVQKDFANTLRKMIGVERSSGFHGREAAIRAVRDFFYKGEIAEQIAEFCQKHNGFLTLDDLRDFHVQVEPPQRGSYKGIDIYTCGFWCQGPVLIQMLQILEGLDVGGMEHNSADYLHAVLEAIKLTFADRHQYYGDPEFVDVPSNIMSREYAGLRRSLIDMKKAWPEMPPPGDPRGMRAELSESARLQPQMVGAVDETKLNTGGTAHLCIVDRWGNAFSATPSDLSVKTPIVPGLGFGISCRGNQAWLDPRHPACIAPWKRPRLTPNPALSVKDGKLHMAFGSPAVDSQAQAMTQVFLNVVEFGMDPQQAVEKPRVISASHPDSSWPHPYNPGVFRAESRISNDTLSELESRGHKLERWPEFITMAGAVCAITVDHERGLLVAGADPRLESAAAGR